MLESSWTWQMVLDGQSFLTSKRDLLRHWLTYYHLLSTESVPGMCQPTGRSNTNRALVERLSGMRYTAAV
ncbi:hypothetical protein LINPERHAP2_LOCUS33221 [Linum perenne]